ncbi:MAG: NADH-quinone oxidoreductase subunit A [Acidobacteriota bacterium]|jgi:NADH-quinone oxidoreductase subunit A|nr:NADH-quinone oxidoreductase subunit A [Acidobacteriota bacterium]NLT32574.1 NADH-quinone oxidoreductase subunit A [Acidobacteriota bacterium]
MNPLIPLAVMALLVAGIVALFILASVFLGPGKRHPVKDTPFECGIPSEGFAGGRMHIGYYIMAMLFVVFDVELAFLFPWAAALRGLGWFGFVAMFLFIAVIGAGFAYAWKMGALEWE